MEGAAIKIITVLNLKGGTAKSTTTKNLAYLLNHDYGMRVLTGDLDCSGNLSLSFQCRPERNDTNCMSRLLIERDADPHDVIVHTAYEGLDIIPANGTLKPTDTQMRLDTHNPQQFRLRRQMAKLEHEYDYCIFDCPPAEDLVVINALAASSEVIIPTTVNQDSLDAIVRVSELIAEVQDYNPALHIRGVLFTRIRNNGVDREGVSMEIPFPKFKTYIREAIAAERSRFMNQSIREYQASSAPAIDYDNLAAEYMGLPPVHSDAPYLRDMTNDQLEHCE